MDEPTPPEQVAGEGADAADRVADGLVADWVVTLFRPFPTAGDLERLTAAVAAALRAACQDADARVAAVARAVDQAAREIHAGRHEGLFPECPQPPCPALREAVRRAQSA